MSHCEQKHSKIEFLLLMRVAKELKVLRLFVYLDENEILNSRTISKTILSNLKNLQGTQLKFYQQPLKALTTASRKS